MLPLQYFFVKSSGTFPIKERKLNPFIWGRKSLVGIVKGKNIGEIVKKSVELIGGIERLNVGEKEVLVKPNVNSDDPYPGTTNPSVVKGVVELLCEAKASKVIVGDMSNPHYPTKDSMRKTGIQKAAEDAGAQIVYFDDDEWITVKPEQAEYFKSFLIPKTVYEAEKIVSVPVIKTHSIATYSMSLKNWVGIIHPRNRSVLHTSRNIEEMIAEIGLAIHPDLIIMDGTKSMVAGGPFRGTTRGTNIVLASGDRVAIDAVGLSIVKSFGLWDRVVSKSIWEQRQIKRAVELKLGATSARDIKLVAHSDTKDTEFSQLVDSINANLGS